MSMINIFIPVYNGEEYLEKTIENVLKSTYKDFEILFVDDGSSDSSLEILKAASLKDDRIKVFSKKNEGSVPFGWNYIFDHINSPWTLYMSQDDMIDSSLLENLIKRQELTSADCVIPSCRFFSEDEKIDFRELNKKNDMTERSKQGAITGRQAFELMFDYEIPGFALWRSEIIKKVGMPTEAFNSDEGMQRVWVLNCEKVAFEPTPFYYRQRKNSIGYSFKPYHFFSVRTEKRLLKIAKEQNISSEKIRIAQYKSLFWTLWLYSYKKAYKIADEDNEIKDTLDDAYSCFKNDLPSPTNSKEKVLSLVSKTSVAKKIYIAFYSKYLKKKLG